MSWGLCVGVLGSFFFVVCSLVCGSGIPFVGCDCIYFHILTTMHGQNHIKQILKFCIRL